MGKVGYFIWLSEATANAAGIDDVSVSDSGGGIVLGMGAEYRLSERLSLRLEWQHYRIDVDADVLSGIVIWNL